MVSKRVRHFFFPCYITAKQNYPPPHFCCPTVTISCPDQRIRARVSTAPSAYRKILLKDDDNVDDKCWLTSSSRSTKGCRVRRVCIWLTVTWGAENTSQKYQSNGKVTKWDNIECIGLYTYTERKKQTHLKGLWKWLYRKQASKKKWLYDKEANSNPLVEGYFGASDDDLGINIGNGYSQRTGGTASIYKMRWTTVKTVCYP